MAIHLYPRERLVPRSFVRPMPFNEGKMHDLAIPVEDRC